MTKKDYIRLAIIISNSRDEVPGYIPLSTFLKDLCVVLKADNPRFNEDKFKRACNQPKA
jgi:hypothetical protein